MGALVKSFFASVGGSGTWRCFVRAAGSSGRSFCLGCLQVGVLGVLWACTLRANPKQLELARGQNWSCLELSCPGLLPWCGLHPGEERRGQQQQATAHNPVLSMPQSELSSCCPPVSSVPQIARPPVRWESGLPAHPKPAPRGGAPPVAVRGSHATLAHPWAAVARPWASENRQTDGGARIFITEGPH